MRAGRRGGSIDQNDCSKLESVRFRGVMQPPSATGGCMTPRNLTLSMYNGPWAFDKQACLSKARREYYGSDRRDWGLFSRRTEINGFPGFVLKGKALERLLLIDAVAFIEACKPCVLNTCNLKPLISVLLLNKPPDHFINQVISESWRAFQLFLV